MQLSHYLIITNSIDIYMYIVSIDTNYAEKCAEIPREKFKQRN